MLGMWVTVSIVEILSIPVWLAAGAWMLYWRGWQGLALWIVLDFALMLPHVAAGVRSRGLSVAHVTSCLLFVFLNRFMNMYFVWKALVSELILKKPLVEFEKGH